MNNEPFEKGILVDKYEIIDKLGCEPFLKYIMQEMFVEMNLLLLRLNLLIEKLDY